MKLWKYMEKFKYLTFERACMELSRSNLRIERLVQRRFWEAQKGIARDLQDPFYKFHYSTVSSDIDAIFCWCRPLDREITVRADALESEYVSSYQPKEDFALRLQELHTLLQADFRRQRLVLKTRLVCEPLEREVRSLECHLREVERRRDLAPPAAHGMFARDLKNASDELAEVKAKLSPLLEEHAKAAEKQNRIYFELKKNMCL